MKPLLIISVLIIVSSLSGCYYDKQDLLNPPSTCDTTIATFSASVNPVITASCTGCHSGDNAPLGIKLDTYSGVSSAVANNKLLDAIMHNPGVTPMPKNGSKLSDCNIAKISKWISLGTPDN